MEENETMNVQAEADLSEEQPEAENNFPAEQDDEENAVTEPIRTVEDGYAAFAEKNYGEAEKIFQSINAFELSPMALYGEGLSRLYKEDLENVRSYTLKLNQALEVAEEADDIKKIILMALDVNADLEERVNGMVPSKKRTEVAPYIVYVDNCYDFCLFMMEEIETRKLMDDVELNRAYYTFLKAAAKFFRKVDSVPRVDRKRYGRDFNLFKLILSQMKANKYLPETEEDFKAAKEVVEDVDKGRKADDKKARRLMIFMLVVCLFVILFMNRLLGI
ncbi:MAG: hypothetical protein LUE88_08600 [Clostridiales bacterium]|nr:hypothetical protein [Clostridiales bacterium]